MHENDEWIIKIAKLEDSCKSAHKRIDDLQTITKAFYDLASDVKVMVSEMSTMKSDITTIKKDINTYHTQEPGKLIFNMKNAVLVGVAGAIVGALISLIIK